MKKIILSLLGIAFFAACSNDDDFGSGGNLTTVSFNVDAKYNEDNFEGLAAENAEISLTNNNTGDTYTMLTDANGTANFETVLPGTYNLTASSSLDANSFTELFGYAPSQEEVVFNGAQEQITVNANTTSASVELNAARMGDLVIKQIYYAGSDVIDGALFRDQFIEIYNNSNEVIYADGLYIAQLFGNTSTTSETYTLPSGQYDWSQSIGMGMGNTANTDYVYADYVIQIPGNGQEKPIQPGESIVIAQNALNHQEPLVDNNGDPVSIGNPALTVDLSGADYEVYLGDFRVSIGEEPYQWDIQNPAVQDMQIAYWGRENYYSSNKDFVLDSFGRDSFAIFRAEEAEFTGYEDYSKPSIVQVEDDTNFYLQIPVTNIIDGVDLQHYNPGSPRPKMLPSQIDASATFVDGKYNSQSIMRKTKNTVNGRIILEDSNNSAQDFKIMQKAEPRGF